MKRLALTISLLGGMVLSSSAVQAASYDGPVRHDRVPPLLARAYTISHSVADRSMHQQTVSGAIQSSPQLKIPYNPSYPPVGFSEDYNQPLSTDDATNTTFIGYPLHYYNGNQNSYKALGALGAWYQQFHMPLPDGYFFFLAYQGTYYTTPETAITAFNDVAASGAGNITTCSVGGAQQCLDVVLKSWVPLDNGVPRSSVFRVLLKSNALFEASYTLPDSDFAANRAAGDQYIMATEDSWLKLFQPQSGGPTPTPVTPGPIITPPTLPPHTTPTTPVPTTPVPPQTVYNIVTVRFEKAGTTAKLSNVAIHKVKLGAKVNLVGYFEVKSAVPGLPISITFTLSRGKTKLAEKTQAGNLDSADPTGIYHAPIQVKLPKKAGTYKGTVTVTISGQTQSGSATLKVAKA